MRPHYSPLDGLQASPSHEVKPMFQHQPPTGNDDPEREYIQRLEEALRASEARYRSLFEDNQSIMLLIDTETAMIVDANSAAAAFYGWTREQLRTMRITAIDVFTAAEIGAEFARAQVERRNFVALEHRRADGSIRDVEVFTSAVVLDGRSMAYAIVQDVTLRKRAEEALRRSEESLRQSQAVAHLGHWTWDVRHDTVTWSDEMVRIAGHDPATFDGDVDTALARAVHPDDVALVWSAIGGAIENQQLDAMELRVVWPDGSIHYVQALPGRRTFDAQGHVTQLSGVVRDVTERKLRDLEREHLLLQLQANAEQLAQVMRSVPEGVLLLNNKMCPLLANPEAQKVLANLAEYDEEQRLVSLGGTNVEALLTSPPLGQWHIVQVGRQILEVIARPLESGPVSAGWVMVLRDVTVERAVQEQLQRQERLAAVGQLAAGIAHDFNNIMSIITIYAELTSVASGLTDKERARALTIIEQAQRATRMIRQILDFSRQSVFERKVVDLLPLLKEEEKLLRQTLPENVEIMFDAARGEYFVEADPTRIQQLIVNLAVNARDAMPQGGHLRIVLERVDVTAGKHAPVANMAAGEWVRIDVQDTGAGIRPEHIAHVFEPFFTTKEPGKGTGLGLAQAHGMVAQHDGHIVVSSEPGVGTTFSIYLPAQRMTAETGGSGAGRPGMPEGRGERVLLVEDDMTLRTSLAELLELWGYRVVQATSGEDALTLVQRGTAVELVLSDAVMPRLGGIALAKSLRHAGLQMPIILMSGHPLDEEQVNWQRLGVTAWLEKPPHTLQLAQAIAQALHPS
jgi:two-component system, cell cycle sensor histidine kinase and response regulator CckA